jgi:dihydrofolate reductase
MEMGKIVVSMNVTLDGVAQDPDGQEGFELGGWFHQFVGQDLEGWSANETEELLGAEALLLGRRSSEWFESRMPSRDSEDVRVSREWADRMHNLPKYVVSSTLEDPQWSNTTVLNGGAVKEISELKRNVDGDILVYGSCQLVHTLIEHDLVDELRLVVFPVALGAGERFFGETSDKTPMRLINTRTIGDGLVQLTYELVRQA